MQKPKKHKKEYYDYNECRDYLQEKYGYDERDYLGMFTGKTVNDNVEYQDFWHWVCDNYEIHNGCCITFDMELLKEKDIYIKPWQKEILKHYLEEFADENGKVELYVWW